jgi:DNA-binding NarL/FixJ family response regulator
MAKELTPKQAHFARCVAQGMTQADAYREAYDPKQSTAATIHTLASRVMARVEVRARVEALIKARERAVVASALYGQRQSSRQAPLVDRWHRGNR